MIYSVTVTNHLGESLVLNLRSPEESGLLIQNITGLGSPQTTINSYELATIDGSRYINSKAQMRNICFTLYPLDLFSESVEDNRQKVYRYFPIKQKIRLDFITDNRNVYIYGYVESNDPDIFSDSESITISVLCPDPYFYLIGEGENVLINGVEPYFQFEFSNESLTDNLLEISRVVDSNQRTIVYSGDAEIGVTITMHFVGSVSGKISIYNLIPSTELMIIDTSKLSFAIQANDDIVICSIKGEKHVHHIRNGVVTNILNTVEKGAIWFSLKQGSNTFMYVADTGEENIQLYITYVPAYQGV